jgi:hypothetical protein
LAVTSHRLIAEQTFGFWTDLLTPHHYRLIGGSAIHAFANRPSAITRANISDGLYKIRQFRNRINHNEPTFLHNHVINFTPVIDVYDTMIDMFNWFDPDLIKFIKSLDKVNRTVSRCQNIL